MPTAMQRIPVLVTIAEKKSITARAKAAGLSVGEFLRQAAAAFRPGDDSEVLDKLLHEMEKSTERANAALDDANIYIEASNRRLATLEKVRMRAAQILSERR